MTENEPDLVGERSYTNPWLTGTTPRGGHLSGRSCAKAEGVYMFSVTQMGLASPRKRS